MRNANFYVASVLLFLIGTSTVFSQTPPSDFLSARHKRDDAMRSEDAKVYAKYTTDSFVVVMPDGSLETKAERLAIMAKAKGTEQLGIPTRDERMTIVGDTIILNWIAAIQGKDARFTEVWVKVDGAWKVAGAHVSMVASRS